ncbi:MAG: DUF4412 domain-containing protein [Bacteroidales bacterium]|nr:DUF4412 domain-containing protein [Bacteroidales bacterium]
MLKRVYTILIISLFSIPTSVFAGWVIVEQKSSPQGIITHDTISVQNNKMRSGGKEATYIYDLNKNEITVINNFYKTYWTGTVEQYRAGLIAGIKVEIDAMVSKMPKDKQEAARSQFESMLKVFESQDGNPKKNENKVSTKKIIDRTQVLGYNTQRHEFYLNGEKKLTTWISEKINISNDFDLDKFSAFMNKMMNNNAQLSIKSTPEYTKMMKQGYPLKTIEYVGSKEVVGEVLSAKKQNLPDAHFKPNPSFKAITIEELVRSIRKPR